MNSGELDQVSEGILEKLRWEPDAGLLIANALRVQQMLALDALYTLREVREYVETGDQGAARSMIQHAKGQHRLWQQANSGE